MFVGFGKSMIALMWSSPIRIPSAENIWPKYLTSLGPNWTFDGLSVRPAACCMVLNVFSKSTFPCWTTYRYAVVHLHYETTFRPKCEIAASGIIRDNRNGAFAIPKRFHFKAHSPFCVTKAVFPCSASAAGIWWYSLCMSRTVLNYAPATVMYQCVLPNLASAKISELCPC